MAVTVKILSWLLEYALTVRQVNLSVHHLAHVNVAENLARGRSVKKISASRNLFRCPSEVASNIQTNLAVSDQKPARLSSSGDYGFRHGGQRRAILSSVGARGCYFDSYRTVGIWGALH